MAAHASSIAVNVTRAGLTLATAFALTTLRGPVVAAVDGGRCDRAAAVPRMGPTPALPTRSCSSRSSGSVGLWLSALVADPEDDRRRSADGATIARWATR